MFRNFEERIKTRLTANNYSVLIALTLSVIFFTIYSYFSILRYYSLDATAWDLGVHLQALNNAFSAKPFYSSLLGESLMGQHFQPFAYVILIFYKAAPSPITLLVIQSFFLAFAGFFLYDISNRILRKMYGNNKLVQIFPALLTFSFLISPFTFSPVLFDFHYLALLPFFYFLTIDSFLAGKKVLHIISLGLIISLHSNFVYIVACILVFEFILIMSQKKHGYFLEWNPERKMTYYLKITAVSFIVLYLYLVLAAFAKGVYLGTPHFSFLPGTGESGAPSSTPLGLLVSIFRSPGKVAALIKSNYLSKVYFFMLIIGTTGIISIIYLPALIPILPYIMYAAFSSYGPYYQLGYQYIAMIEPMFYVSAALSVLWLMKTVPKIRHAKLRKIFKKYSIGISLFLVVAILIAIPFSPVSPNNIYQGGKLGPLPNLRNFEATPATDLIFEIGNELPKNAFLLTQNNLEPYFPSYINVDATPYSPTVVPNVSNFTYLVIETSNFWSSYSPTIPSLYQYTNYYLQHGWSVFAESGSYSILAIQKQHSDAPLKFQPIKQSMKFHYISNTFNNSTGTTVINGSFDTNTLFPGNYTINVTSYDAPEGFQYTIAVNSSAFLDTVSNSSEIYHNFTFNGNGQISFKIDNRFLLGSLGFHITVISKEHIPQINSVSVMQTST